MTPSPLFSRWKREAKQLFQLSLPILIGQLAITGMGVTDTIMAGNYRATDLAAIAIGQSFWLPTFIFFVGFFNATTTLIAHHHGAKNTEKISRLFLQSLIWAILFIPLGVLFLTNSDQLISLLKLEEALFVICRDYLFALAFGFPAAIIFLSIRGLSEGMGETRPIMLIQLIIFLCNIPLNYGLIYGKWGLPTMGGVGCGVATALVLWLQCLCGFILLNKHPLLKSLLVFQQTLRPHKETLLKLWRLGLPIAFTFLAEVLLFSVIALIIVPLGAEVIAGHQIALSVSAITFMLPLSMGMAITIRIGQKLGGKQQKQANIAFIVGLSVMLATALLSMTAIFSLRALLATAYSNDPVVINIASGLLFFTAIYQIPDAIQIGMTSALRGYQDTRIPLTIVLIAYWVISVPVGWSLCFGKWGNEPYGAAGMWLGLVVGLSCAAVFQGLRFWRVSQRVI